MTPSFADAAAGLRHVTLARAEGQHLFEHLPVAAGGLVPRRRVFGKVQREPADERAVGVVQLDGGGQPIPREVGRSARPRAPARSADPGALRDEVGERGQRVNLIERLLEPAAQLVALRQRLRRVLRFDDLLFARVPNAKSDGYNASDGAASARNSAAETLPPATRAARAAAASQARATHTAAIASASSVGASGTARVDRRHRRRRPRSLRPRTRRAPEAAEPRGTRRQNTRPRAAAARRPRRPPRASGSGRSRPRSAGHRSDAARNAARRDACA